MTLGPKCIDHFQELPSQLRDFLLLNCFHHDFTFLSAIRRLINCLIDFYFFQSKIAASILRDHSLKLAKRKKMIKLDNLVEIYDIIESKRKYNYQVIFFGMVMGQELDYSMVPSLKLLARSSTFLRSRRCCRIS